MTAQLRLVALALVLAVPSAHAADWKTTFEPGAVGAQLSGTGQRYLVVAAGDVAAARPAAAALIQALRSSGKAALVMDDQVLGDVGGQADPAILARTAKLPVDLVAILRVFPASPPSQLMAVCTVYDKAGAVQVAFTAEQGKPLAPPASPAAAGGGVSSETVAAVSKTTTDRSAAQEQYDEKFIGYEEVVGVTRSGAAVALGALPYRGKYRKPLPGALFYEAVERPDLAATYRQNEGRKLGLVLGGGTVFLGGLVVSTVGFMWGCIMRGDGYCGQNPINVPLLLVGSAGTVVGTVLMVMGFAVNPHPVEPPEARRLVDEYNKRLKSQLQLTLAPSVGPGGGGLLLAGSF